MNDVETTPYDGCGNCWVGIRRLSRKTDKTSSPERQAEQILKAAAGNGGHVIAWADDWEVSGATNPLDRPAFGPWLKGEKGPYDGITAASVDRVGRNVRDTLNTQDMLTRQGRAVVTADHSDGVWDFTDPNQENEWMIKAWGSQMELRAIQKRNRDETVRARSAGEPKQRPSYGYRFERPAPTAKISAVVIDDVAAAVIRQVKDRILAAFNGELEDKVTVSTEAVRLTREGVVSPMDRLAELYGRPPKGRPWTHAALRHVLTSEAALGYLMHQGRPVTGADGRPVRIAEPLWDRTTHEALVAATAPRERRTRAPKGTQLLSGIAFCGTCGARLYINGKRKDSGFSYGCTGRVRGIPASANCKPAPSVSVAALDAETERWFLERYGWLELMERVWDPGTGHAAQIAELEAARERLRADRLAGLYDAPDDAEWYRREYARMGAEIAELAAAEHRDPGFVERPTGRRVADEWNAADGPRRREMLAAKEVRVTVRPRGHGERVTITGL